MVPTSNNRDETSLLPDSKQWRLPLSFFDELKRRNVFRVGTAYVVASWVVLQVADLVLETTKAPDWVLHTQIRAIRNTPGAPATCCS